LSKILSWDDTDSLYMVVLTSALELRYDVRRETRVFVGAANLQGAFEQSGCAFCAAVSCWLAVLDGQVTYFVWL